MFRSVLIVFLLSALGSRLIAQESTTGIMKTVVSEMSPGVPESPVAETLGRFLVSIEALKIEQSVLREKIESMRAASEGESDINLAEEDLIEVTQELAKMRSKFEQLALGMDEDSLDETEAKDINLQEELAILLKPMLYELRKTTERPREIEALRSVLSLFEQRQEAVDQSIARLDSLISKTIDPELVAKLEELQRRLLVRKGRIKSELEAAQFQLEEALEEQESVFSVAGRFASEFIARRGKSFGLAVLSALGTIGFFVLLKRLSRRFMPGAERARRSIPYRVLKVIYFMLAVLSAIMVFLGVLYTQSDWLLLGLSLIFLVGVVWAAKQTLLSFYEQLKTVLNLGPVREGERVIFDGIPWEVKSINFYTELVNPMLTGGTVRVAIGDLTDLHSRPKARKEPLFPCRVGEWVQLSDGTFGEVLSQTPELVRLRTVPGSVVSYQTSAFLGLAPDNHSEKFGLRVTVGIDYRHQAVSTRQIREKLEEHIREGLRETIGKENLLGLWVEFASAGASSLDYCVGATFDGRVANRKPFLGRSIHRHFVDACNENGWVIPFTQITVHQAA